MPLNEEAIIKAIEEAKGLAKKRNFKQSVELIIKLKDVDLKRPENRLTTTVALPHVPPEKLAKICVFATGDLALKAKEVGVDAVLSREDLESLSGDKRRAKELAKKYDFFLAQPDLMPIIGRILGPYLGPRGKMPSVLVPSANLKAVIERQRKSVLIRVRDQPQIMCWIGLEDQPAKAIAENALTVINAIEAKYKYPQNIEKMYIKLTMGPAVKVKLR